MKKRKLDVLVTFYNQEKYVDRALTSIFSQECNFEFHVLVGDDGSTDRTLEIVKKWQAKYPGEIEIFIMPRETGEKYIGGFRASQNRLNLLKQVRTEYFVFLDGDDFFSDTHKFQKQVDILDDPKNRDCIGCSHSIDAAYPDGSRRPYLTTKVCEGKYGVKRYWFELYFHTDTTMARSSVIDSVPFELLENNFNDNLITYFILQKGKLYYYPEAMAVYDQTGEGIWTGEKAIVNNLRNMLVYDLCIKINSRLRLQSDIRFSGTWKNLFHLRDKINVKELRQIMQEAEEKDLKYSLLWLNYKELSMSGKVRLYIVLWRIAAEQLLYRCIRKGIILFKKFVLK